MTKLTNIKDNIPIYVEQKFIQTDLQAKDILKTRTLIPSKFVKLEKVGKNNWGSTENLPKILCERYGFSNQGEWIQLDIPHTLLEKLDLVKAKDIPHPVYISPEVLKRKPTCGGITLKSEKEIFIKQPTQKDQSTQTENVSKINKVQLLLTKTQSLRTEKKELLTKISELEKGNNLNQQTIIGLQGEVAELEEKLNNEKELSLQLQTRIMELTNTLQIENQTKTRLTAQLEELQNTITQWRNRFTAETERLNGESREKEQELNQKNNEIARIENKVREVERERDSRPTQEQLNNIRQELYKANWLERLLESGKPYWWTGSGNCGVWFESHKNELADKYTREIRKITGGSNDFQIYFNTGNNSVQTFFNKEKGNWNLETGIEKIREISKMLKEKAI